MIVSEGVIGKEGKYYSDRFFMIRTLLLENWLRAFMVALLATLQSKVSLQQVLRLLFERSGSRIETPSQVLY